MRKVERGLKQNIKSPRVFPTGQDRNAKTKSISSGQHRPFVAGSGAGTGKTGAGETEGGAGDGAQRVGGTDQNCTAQRKVLPRPRLPTSALTASTYGPWPLEAVPCPSHPCRQPPPPPEPHRFRGTRLQEGAPAQGVVDDSESVSHGRSSRWRIIAPNGTRTQGKGRLSTRGTRDVEGHTPALSAPLNGPSSPSRPCLHLSSPSHSIKWRVVISLTPLWSFLSCKAFLLLMISRLEVRTGRKTTLVSFQSPHFLCFPHQKGARDYINSACVYFRTPKPLKELKRGGSKKNFIHVS